MFLAEETTQQASGWLVSVMGAVGQNPPIGNPKTHGSPVTQLATSQEKLVAEKGILCDQGSKVSHPSQIVRYMSASSIGVQRMTCHPPLI